MTAHHARQEAPAGGDVDHGPVGDPGDHAGVVAADSNGLMLKRFRRDLHPAVPSTSGTSPPAPERTPARRSPPARRGPR